jgi:hypothetical protein
MPALPLPGSSEAVVAAPAPGQGPQWWAGAPSAVECPDGTFAIAYRVRRGSGEDDEVVIATSNDGERLETVAVLDKRRHGAAMTERPALLRLPDGRWRLYASFATPDSLHWWVGLVEADSLAGLADAPQTVVFPGDASTGVKDPLVTHDGTRWQAWLCHHLLDIPGEEDRMETAWATSDDGISWSAPVVVLRGRPGRWDARGARMTALLPGGRVAYDGRASREENWFERTGIAAANGDGTFTGDGEPVSTARYLDVVPLRNGGYRIYYEQVTPDESHELRTELILPDAP